jgi:hypothetical protein
MDKNIHHNDRRELSTITTSHIINHQTYSSFSNGCGNQIVKINSTDCFNHKYAHYWCCYVFDKMFETKYCNPYSNIVAKSKLKETNSFYKFECKGTNIMILYSIAIIYFLLYI